MALKAVPDSQVPHIDRIPEHVTFPLHYGAGENDYDDVGDRNKMASFNLSENKFVVMGHRGNGMNMLQSENRIFKTVKENTLRSFNEAAKFNVDFIEFDIQVTRDGHPVIFHDIFIFIQEEGKLIEKRVADHTLDEFLAYGPQSTSTNGEKPLFRKTKDGRIFEWKVDEDDRFCTLEDVFENASQSVGFNIEFKFDDNRSYKEEELVRVIRAALQVVFKHSKDWCIMFSSFQPDAAQLIRKQQTVYQVFFLTNGGSEIHSDIRRNSLDEAIKLCLEGVLQGIVSEVKAILRNPRMIAKIEESNLTLLTYGQLK